MPHIAHNYTAALVCMSVAIGFCSFHYSGVVVNVQDIAGPKYTGSVYGEYPYCCSAAASIQSINVYMNMYNTWPACCCNPSYSVVTSKLAAYLLVADTSCQLADPTQ